MCSRDCLNTISGALVIGASANTIYTLFMIANYSESQGFCGPEGMLIVQSPLLALVPLNYIFIMAGMAGLVSPYVKDLIKRGFSRVDLKRLFMGMVVSGGSVYYGGNKYCIRFYGKDLLLHTIFADLAYVLYDKRPGTTDVRGSYVTQLYSKEAVRELREASPEFETRRGGAPSLSFILEGGRDVKVEASRVLMSTSGWISCSFVNTTCGVRAYPKLGIGSVLPGSMLLDYSKLMAEVGLRFSVYQDKRYDGRGYLATSDLMMMKRFRNQGGFIEGTVVKRGEFAGMEKNSLLAATMRVASLKFFSREEAIEKIREFGTNDELKVYLNRLMLG
ncbi:MAG: hypothetical protein H5T34_05610 [Candidatus Methanomethyliales bacterium]|nr:hypothetical protein [Candidatus Methanomethylicales archaeon]